MIEAKQITKSIGPVMALQDLSCQIQPGSIFGLVGSNGAGKSTFLRLLAGVLRPDRGTLAIDGQSVYENPTLKRRISFVADQPFFRCRHACKTRCDFYQTYYPQFSMDHFQKLCQMFPVDTHSPVQQMSKGMQRQVILMLSLACQPDFLLLDETFDGLDPVVRQLTKRLLADAVAGRGLTVLIASHNLRELEDICDHIGLLHRGGILFEQELDALKFGIQKVQVVFAAPTSREELKELDILRYKTRGALAEMVVRGQRDETLASLQARAPVFVEALPLTLEEVFIQELEMAGYDVNTFLE